jgi:hypothetical protein
MIDRFFERIPVVEAFSLATRLTRLQKTNEYVYPEGLNSKEKK